MSVKEEVLPVAQEKQLQDYFRIIVRRRRIFLFAFCLILIGTIVYTYQLTPIYEAVTILRVKDDSAKNSLSLGRELSGPQNNMDTEIQILRSMTNAEQVAQLLHLTWSITDSSKGLLFTVAEFETPGVGVSYNVELTGPDRYIVKDKEGRRIGEGKNNVPLQADKFRLLLTSLKGKTGDSFQLTMQSLDEQAGDIVAATAAGQVGTGTGILRLSARNPSPARARDIANTLAKVYAEQNLVSKGEEARKSIDFVEEQMKVTHAALEEAENKVQQYKASTRTYSLDASTSALVDQLSELDQQKATLGMQKRLAEQAYTSLKQSIAVGRPLLPSSMKDDPLAGVLVDKIVELEIQKKILKLEKGEGHPAVQAIQIQIDESTQKLRSSYDASLKSMTTEERELGKQASKLEGQLSGLPDVERQLANLTRVATVNVNIYTFLLQKHEELRIAKAALVSNIQIIDVAKLPRTSVYPNRKKNILLGFLMGLMVGGALAFFVDFLDDTLKDAEEVRFALRMPILATIPYIAMDPVEDESAPAILAYRAPKNAISEAFRSLRTSVHFSAISADKKVILITSSFPGEGKTTIISNLAVTLSQAGSRVLIIDCDMRRPSLHKVFRREKIPGLSEILAGDVSIEETLINTPANGLDFIPAGTSPPNPSELLSSKQFQDLLEHFKLTYDNILLDAPPVLAVTDAPLLTTAADIMILVLETERVPLKTAQRTMEMLDMVKAPIAGIVLNDKTGQAQRYGYYGNKYYSYSYGYGYSYYGEKDDTKKASKKKKGLLRFLSRA